MVLNVALIEEQQLAFSVDLERKSGARGHEPEDFKMTPDKLEHIYVRKKTGAQI